MTQAQTIKIFLIEGKPTGVRTIELSGWTGKGFVIPRSNLSAALGRGDLKVPCVYFLIGENDNGQQLVYIGETENFLDRIQAHNKTKDFWTTTICFISKDDTLNKAYVKYLESILYREAKEAGRAQIEAGKDSNPARLSESDLADANYFAEKIRLLLTAIGINFLQKPADEAGPELWYCKGKDADARGKLIPEGFVVLKGSMIRDEEVPSIAEGVKHRRRQILDQLPSASSKSLPEDQVFSSPSTASDFVLGRSSNGWNEWKNADGKTLDEIKRK